MEILKPKSKEEILSLFKWMSAGQFQIKSKEYEETFNEKVPKEYWPLAYHIHEDLKKRVILQYHYGEALFQRSVHKKTPLGEFYTTIKSNFLLITKDNCVSIKMFPYVKKDDRMKEFTFGNEFRFTTFDQYLIFVENYLS
jgi:hypothetical protein